MDSPTYTCPVHRRQLTRAGNVARCDACAEPYPIEDDIWMLDAIRNTERSAFDDQVESDPVPLDFCKAERHL